MSMARKIQHVFKGLHRGNQLSLWNASGDITRVGDQYRGQATHPFYFETSKAGGSVDRFWSTQLQHQLSVVYWGQAVPSDLVHFFWGQQARGGSFLVTSQETLIKIYLGLSPSVKWRKEVKVVVLFVIYTLSCKQYLVRLSPRLKLKPYFLL